MAYASTARPSSLHPSAYRSSYASGSTGSPADDQDKDKKRKDKEKRKRFSWGSLSYTARVTVSFAAIAAMTALVAIGVLSFVWDQHFRTYTQENMESLAESTANSIAQIYAETGTLYDQEIIGAAEYAANLNSGVGVIIRDNETGAIVWDSSTSDLADEGEVDEAVEEGIEASVEAAESEAAGELETADPEGEGEEELSVLPSYSSDVQVAYANIECDGVAVGSVHVWVLGSDTLLRAADEEFRDNSYQAMLFATVLAIVLASCIGYLFARRLVAPINRVSSTAVAIQEGDLSARTGLKGEDEISQLGETFDAMADSIERDRKLERRLTSDVAHELSTPLMAIQATVEAMIDGVYECDEERLETVNSEVQRLSRLVDALLKLSRLENRSTPLKLEVLNVGDLIESIISTHEAFVADAGLKLSYEREDDVYVMGDADMIRQATANLISNAVRYTPEGGSVTVRVFKCEDGTAAIQVQDTGIGLSPDEAKMVFSRFWRADAGRARESGGLGIGLSVVKEIVDQHKGWVDVVGQKGVGSTFTIHIPLYEEEEEELPEGDSSKSSKAQKTRESRSKSGESRSKSKNSKR